FTTALAASVRRSSPARARLPQRIVLRRSVVVLAEAKIPPPSLRAPLREIVVLVRAILSGCEESPTARMPPPPPSSAWLLLAMTAELVSVAVREADEPDRRNIPAPKPGPPGSVSRFRDKVEFLTAISRTLLPCASALIPPGVPPRPMFPVTREPVIVSERLLAPSDRSRTPLP